MSSPTSTCSSGDSACDPRPLSIGKLHLFEFLAVLFMLSLIIGGTLVYRRRLRLMANGEWVQSMQQKKIGLISMERPRIFDGHLSSPVSASGAEQWDAIVPLSATYKSTMANSAPSNQEEMGKDHLKLANSPPTGRTHSPTFKRRCVLSPAHNNIPSSGTNSSFGVEIAYLIAMPTEDQTAGRCHNIQQGLRVFEFGIVEADVVRTSTDV